MVNRYFVGYFVLLLALNVLAANKSNEHDVNLFPKPQVTYVPVTPETPQCTLNIVIIGIH